VNAFNLVIMRNFFQGIPDSLEEAARIDGCSEIGVFLRVVLPLSMASIATIGLFYAVTYWNTYMHAVLYINDSSLWPIQVLLRQIVIVSSGMDADATVVDVVPPAQSVKMAVIAVATLPMLAVYPFVQRYFVKGAMIGSVKGRGAGPARVPPGTSLALAATPLGKAPSIPRRRGSRDLAVGARRWSGALHRPPVSSADLT